jgi:ion channel-forming bestrophin family protein
MISILEIFRSGRTLSLVSILALGFGLYALLPMWKEYTAYAEIADTPPELHVALSLVLGWLLVFRTNMAYARWWEARTLWGALVNATRNLAIKSSRLARVDREELLRMRQLLIDFPIALKLHLRDEPESQEMMARNGISGPWTHVPLALASEVYALLSRWKASGAIDGQELRVLDVEALRLMDICGGCERILRTRIVRSYRIFARQCVLLFLLTMPWALAEDFGWWTVLLTTLTAYFMIGLEVVAEHVEEPFGYDDDDLDLEGLCRTIGKSMVEIIP